MLRAAFITLFCTVLLLPAFSHASDGLETLENVVAANQQVQPGLEHYLVRVETSRIEELMERMTKGIPEDVEPPPTPVIYKFWQRNGKKLIFAESTELMPFVEKMVQQISGNLAIELNEMLLPAGQAGLRKSLAAQADIITSEVVLADSTIKQVELTFHQPTDLAEAFYVRGIRLPQKKITTLAFDINTGMQTVNEMRLSTADGLQLTLEIRYIEVDGGHVPERFNITSPDGSIEDVFEVALTEIDGYVMPTSMLRTIRRQDLDEDLEVTFVDYQINQPIPAELQNRLDPK